MFFALKLVIYLIFAAFFFTCRVILVALSPTIPPPWRIVLAAATDGATSDADRDGSGCELLHSGLLRFRVPPACPIAFRLTGSLPARSP